ncbi:MAG: hypothetical protein HQL41_02970 [Alphaproteobacteria bacterium]|nr:hypothetical protein [Alphaproteobacteria bacterium]
MSRRRNPRREERRKTLILFAIKSAIVLGMVGATGYYSFEAGITLSRQEIATLKEETERLTAASVGHDAEIAQLTGSLDQARRQAADYKARLEQLVPTPMVEKLLSMIGDKLKSGLSPQRIGSFIAAADKPRNCGAAVTKRFVVRTPLSDGGNGWVRFDDIITVTAEGQSARGGGGAPEAWFDPEVPVTVKFAAIGGREEEISGKLPMQHALVLKNEEHRFVIAPGARGFIEIAADRCSFG